MIGLIAAAAGAKNAPPPETPPPPTPYVNVTLSWVGSTNENVSGASGTTSGHFHTVATGTYPPFTISLARTGLYSPAANLANPSSGESAGTWAGLNIGDVATLRVQATATDATGARTAGSNVIAITITRVS